LNGAAVAVAALDLEQFAQIDATPTTPIAPVVNDADDEDDEEDEDEADEEAELVFVVVLSFRPGIVMAVGLSNFVTCTRGLSAGSSPTSNESHLLYASVKPFDIRECLLHTSL
jgi:hypothetical protein